MYRSSVSKNNQALCFLLNRGYFEASSLEDISFVKENIQADSITYVGNIEEIRQFDNTVVYQQRVIFRNLTVMLNHCRIAGVYFMLGNDFHVTVESLQDCFSEFKCMKYYSWKFNEPIDVWLTNCCIIHVHELLKAMNIYTELGSRVDRILCNRIGYFDRAPFLLARYNKNEKTSSIYLETDINDRRLYSMNILDKSNLNYGYTLKNIKNDRKEGLF